MFKNMFIIILFGTVYIKTSEMEKFSASFEQLLKNDIKKFEQHGHISSNIIDEVNSQLKDPFVDKLSIFALIGTTQLELLARQFYARFVDLKYHGAYDQIAQLHDKYVEEYDQYAQKIKAADEVNLAYVATKLSKKKLR